MASTVPAVELRGCRRRLNRDHGLQVAGLHAEWLRNMGRMTGTASDDCNKGYGDQACQYMTIHLFLLPSPFEYLPLGKSRLVHDRRPILIDDQH